MIDPGPVFVTRLASTPADLQAAQRLRYDVFVDELGGTGPGVDHVARLEQDDFDPYCDHLLLVDPAMPQGRHVVGVYRLLSRAQMQTPGGPGRFYTADEYDLGPLLASGRRLLELGRSCVHPAYRGGTAMFHLWQALAQHVAAHRVEVLFGTASFHGTDVAALAEPLSYLHHYHLAPPDLRATALPATCQPMDLTPIAAVDRRRAMLATPALIKAYLRLGGFVGQGAFVDHAFNTTDVCLILDIARMDPRQRALYSPKDSG